MLTTREVGPDDADLAVLLREFVLELSPRYGLDPDAWSGWTPLPADARYLLALDGEEVVGCGAVMPWSHSVPGAPAEDGELKRVFLRPAARGRGLARPLLSALLDLARTLGFVRLHLETGVLQPEAIALYERTGWRRTERYGAWADDPHSVCFELDL